uniref:Uncharacterized protein n=1 Tax=Nelumbo nucifera TaxID=4432 RepID=A0A822Y2K8_NELNU|nr:TPA_asm: hypothetical protein HUJ06_027259 [Nelumbo nucifera]
MRRAPRKKRRVVESTHALETEEEFTERSPSREPDVVDIDNDHNGLTSVDPVVMPNQFALPPTYTFPVVAYEGSSSCGQVYLLNWDVTTTNRIRDPRITFKVSTNILLPKDKREFSQRSVADLHSSIFRDTLSVSCMTRALNDYAITMEHNTTQMTAVIESLQT